MTTHALIASAVFLALNPVIGVGQTTVGSGHSPKRVEQQHIQAVESCLPPPVLVKGEPKMCTSLSKRMAELHVPAVSIAVVHNGRIEWAKGYGVRQIGGEAVNAETLFQAGSISKPLAVLGALHLVQERKLSLDANINASLTSWKLPPGAAPGATVTLRELLTHTATLVQVLNGSAPANTARIRLDSVPGKNWRYSGG